MMPFYIVCDVSWSMADDMPELNRALQDLRSAILAEPAVDDVARIGVLTFSDSARVATSLSQVSEADLPNLSAENGTNYGAAFQLLAQTIETDSRRLKGEGYKLYRPCAFFLTDGLPLDGDWAQTFGSTLTYDPKSGQGMKAHPIFVPFGFREADENVLKRLAFPPDRSRWYLARSTSAADALKGILSIIVNTVLTSSRLATSGERGAVQLADAPGGSNIASGESEYDGDFL